MTPSRIWPVLIASALAIAVLCALGFWQLQRLQWKGALIAEISARQAESPISLGAAIAGSEDIEFRKVAADLKFLPGNEFHMLTSFDGHAGWHIITPAVSVDGFYVLVDRGAVPDELRDDASRKMGADQPVSVLGIVRHHEMSRDYFSPDNDPKGNRWYWWDVPAMLTAANIPQGNKVARFVLQLLPGDDAGAFPRPLPPTANLANNHLQYAINWFALAGVLAVIAGVFLHGRRKSGA